MRRLTLPLGLVMLLTASLTMAESDGVPDDGYWWPYVLYLQVLWIGLPLYIFIRWMLQKRQDRKALKEFERSRKETR